MKRSIRHRLTAVLAALLAIPLAAQAACHRPLNVPVSPSGLSVTINGSEFGGVYPDLLRAIEAKGECSFQFTVVPRARLEALFESGKADLLLPATRTPRRDRHGHFISLIGSRATLISIDPKREPIHSLQQLRERKDLRIALVRGFDYGEAYQAFQKELMQQHRIFLEADMVGVARLLQAGFADVTIMSPTLFAGAVRTDSRVEGLTDRLRIEPLDELPWGESGIYISRSAVSAADRAALETQLAAAVKSGAVWDSYKRYYPPELLAAAMRPH